MDESAPARVEAAVLESLRARLRALRPVETTGVSGWDRGTDSEWLFDLVQYWADGYDWRAHEVLRVWLEPSAGGHFAAWEQPQEYVEGVRAAISLT